jgi:UDP-N-acetylmuramoylalanine--D-glutamate ligase
MTASSEKEGEVAILGLGKSGAAAAKLLLADGKRVYISDSGSAPGLEDIARQLRDIGAAVDTGGH